GPPEADRRLPYALDAVKARLTGLCSQHVAKQAAQESRVLAQRPVLVVVDCETPLHARAYRRCAVPRRGVIRTLERACVAHRVTVLSRAALIARASSHTTAA